MLTYEPLTEENVDKVAELEKECFGKNAWSENLLRGEIGVGNKHYVVVKEDGKVVAYGGFCQVLDEGDVMNIAVTHDSRKKGYATKILERFFTLAKERGITAFTLEVRESNVAARSLYEKVGFSSAGVRTNYYPDGENACIYWKYM